MKLRLCLFCAVALIFLCAASAASAESLTVEMKEAGWTWEENNIASFEGTVASESGLPEKIVMKLEFLAYPESKDSGEVVFSTVNGKKLTLRKQKSDYSLSTDGVKSIGFTAGWKTPESVLFTRIDITLKIYTDDSSALLAEQKFTMSRDASELVMKDDGKIRLHTDFSEWTRWVAVSAAVIWAAALLRILLNYRKNREER